MEISNKFELLLNALISVHLVYTQIPQYCPKLFFTINQTEMNFENDMHQLQKPLKPLLKIGLQMSYRLFKLCVVIENDDCCVYDLAMKYD